MDGHVPVFSRDKQGLLWHIHLKLLDLTLIRQSKGPRVPRLVPHQQLILLLAPRYLPVQSHELILLGLPDHFFSETNSCASYRSLWRLLIFTISILSMRMIWSGLDWPGDATGENIRPLKTVGAPESCTWPLPPILSDAKHESKLDCGIRALSKSLVAILQTNSREEITQQSSPLTTGEWNVKTERLSCRSTSMPRKLFHEVAHNSQAWSLAMHFQPINPN